MIKITSKNTLLSKSENQIKEVGVLTKYSNVKPIIQNPAEFPIQTYMVLIMKNHQNNIK